MAQLSYTHFRVPNSGNFAILASEAAKIIAKDCPKAIKYLLVGKDVYPQYNQDEISYLSLVYQILHDGVEIPNRTGVPAKTLFGENLYFRLIDENGKKILPLITSRRIPFRMVAEELFWFLSGDTNAKSLQAKNIHIWDGNSSREFLDSRGLTDYPEGELGPIYGKQWRDFGGVDQITELVEGIKRDPFSRRHVLSAWNPSELSKMALPPCHLMAIFHVAPANKPECKNRLYCTMIMRSCDAFHGLPWNIASYALLTHLLAETCDLEPASLHISLSNVHVYKEHYEAANELIKREVKNFPQLIIAEKKDKITDYTIDDVSVEGYIAGSPIKVSMVV